jgi:hypothetical protein
MRSRRITRENGTNEPLPCSRAHPALRMLAGSRANPLHMDDHGTARRSGVQSVGIGAPLLRALADADGPMLLADAKDTVFFVRTTVTLDDDVAAKLERPPLQSNSKDCAFCIRSRRRLLRSLPGSRE